MPRPAALARATNCGSAWWKQNSAIAGMFEGNTSTAAPAGEMSSVETLSPSLISTGASSVSATGSPSGTGLMFGPRVTSPWASGGAVGGDEPGRRGGEVPRQVGLGRGAHLARVGDAPGERRGRGGHRGAEVDLVVLHAAPSREVAVEGAQALRPRGRHVADARARPARGLRDERARGQQVRQQPL